MEYLSFNELKEIITEGNNECAWIDNYDDAMLYFINTKRMYESDLIRDQAIVNNNVFPSKRYEEIIKKKQIPRWKEQITKMDHAIKSIAYLYTIK